jgi:HTH-type transcriptional regulator/antitoxin HigA
LVWQAHILQNIAQETLDTFSLETLDTAFIEELLTFSLYSKGPLLVKDYLQSYGIHFVIEQHLLKTYVDGASFKAHDDKPVIVLTLRHDRVDNFWFTLLHELGHVTKHLYDGTDNRAFFDDTSFNSEACDSKLEQEANLFAMEHLIPSSIIEKSDLSTVSLWTPSKIIETSKVIRRSPAILAGRIRYESGNYAAFSELLGTKGLKCLFQNGF